MTQREGGWKSSHMFVDISNHAMQDNWRNPLLDDLRSRGRYPSRNGFSNTENQNILSEQQ